MQALAGALFGELVLFLDSFVLNVECKTQTN